MNTKEYLEIREATKLLYHKIMEWGEDKFNIDYALKTLNFFNKGVLHIDSQDEDDNLTEYLIFVSKYKGKRVLELFYDSDIELDDKEEILLEAMIDCQMHILEITDSDPNPDRYRVFMKDLITSVPYEIVNVGISQTSKAGQVLCSHLIEIGNEIYMTSGYSFLFSQVAKKKLLADYSFEKFKRNRNLVSEELFLFCHKKNQEYGSKTMHLDTSQILRKP